MTDVALSVFNKGVIGKQQNEIQRLSQFNKGLHCKKRQMFNTEKYNTTTNEDNNPFWDSYYSKKHSLSLETLGAWSVFINLNSFTRFKETYIKKKFFILFSHLLNFRKHLRIFFILH